eukprot:scaffold2045_cov404-Prasinococcus_capsulatus_cf.AAC.2
MLQDGGLPVSGRTEELCDNFCGALQCDCVLRLYSNNHRDRKPVAWPSQAATRGRVPGARELRSNIWLAALGAPRVGRAVSLILGGCSAIYSGARPTPTTLPERPDAREGVVCASLLLALLRLRMADGAHVPRARSSFECAGPARRSALPREGALERRLQRTHLTPNLIILKITTAV